MSTFILGGPQSHRRIVVAGLATAVLALIAFLATSPRSASAAPVACAGGEFCLYYLDDLKGGRYHFTGSDSWLGNDEFEDGEGSDVTVAKQAASAWNNGDDDPSDQVDVLVYTGRGFHGRVGCVGQDQSGDLLEGFANKIQSYRWVTPAQCAEEVNALETALNQSP